MEVSHDLIPICLDRMHLPVNVKEYNGALYKNLKGKIRTSEEFRFNKGVFQGDQLCPIMFIFFFKPNIEGAIEISG